MHGAWGATRQGPAWEGGAGPSPAELRGLRAARINICFAGLGRGAPASSGRRRPWRRRFPSAVGGSRGRRPPGGRVRGRALRPPGFLARGLPLRDRDLASRPLRTPGPEPGRAGSAVFPVPGPPQTREAPSSRGSRLGPGREAPRGPAGKCLEKLRANVQTSRASGTGLDARPGPVRLPASSQEAQPRVARGREGGR